MLADVFSIGSEAVRCVELTSGRGPGFIEYADTAVNQGKRRALADVEIVEVLAMEIQAALRIEKVLGCTSGPGHQALGLIGCEGVGAGGDTGVKVVRLTAAHLVIVDGEVGAPFVPLLHPCTWLGLRQQQPLPVQVKPVVIGTGKLPAEIVLDV